MITAQQLRELLQVCKDFELPAVSLKTPDLELTCTFPTPPSATANLMKKPAMAFPEARYNAVLQTRDITAEELQELGFAGVSPTVTPSNKKS